MNTQTTFIISCESDSPVAACDNLQAASDKLEEWRVENRMKIQTDKVCWVLVSLSHLLDRKQFSLSYEGKCVRQETEMTYIEEMIGCRVTIVKYREKNITQAKLFLGLVRYALPSRTCSLQVSSNLLELQSLVDLHMVYTSALQFQRLSLLR